MTEMKAALLLVVLWIPAGLLAALLSRLIWGVSVYTDEITKVTNRRAFWLNSAVMGWYLLLMFVVTGILLGPPDFIRWCRARRATSVTC